MSHQVNARAWVAVVCGHGPVNAPTQRYCVACLKDRNIARAEDERKKRIIADAQKKRIQRQKAGKATGRKKYVSFP